MSKTAIEIIDETVEHYRTNLRARTDAGSCRYYVDGAMCAVGRCLVNPEDYAHCDMGVYDFRVNRGFPLKKEYEGHPIAFWAALQHLHDIDEHWYCNDKGGYSLSESGYMELARLKYDVASGYYDYCDG